MEKFLPQIGNSWPGIFDSNYDKISSFCDIFLELEKRLELSPFCINIINKKYLKYILLSDDTFAVKISFCDPTFMVRKMLRILTKFVSKFSKNKLFGLV